MFSKYIISSANNNFISSFSVGCVLFPLSYLISLDRTSSAMLNRRGRNKYPCLVPNLRWNPSIFPHWVLCSSLITAYVLTVVSSCSI